VEAIVGCNRQQMRVTSSATNTPVGDVSSLSITTDGQYTALRVTMAIENPGVAEFVRVTPSAGCTVEPAQFICEFTASRTGESARTLGVDVRVSAVGSTIVFVNISADGGPSLESDVTIGSEVNPSPPRPFMVTGDAPMATRGDYEGTLVTEARTPFPDLHGSALLNARPETATYGPASITPTGTVSVTPTSEPLAVNFDFAQDPSGTVTRVDLAFTVMTESDPDLHYNRLEVQVNGSPPITLHAPTSIVSNDVTIIASDPTATEAGATTGAFTVSRDGSVAEPLTVFYGIGGTATPGVDYVRLRGSVTIPKNMPTASITVTPIDDAVMEGPETVVLRLLPTPAYTVGTPNSATVNITSNEVVTVVAQDATASEVGRTTGTFRVSRTGNATAPLTVVYTLGGTARRGTDYTAPLNVMIPAGALSANITVTPLDDVLMTELTETVVLALTPRPTYTVGPARSATVKITRTSSAPLVTVVATDPTATETGRTTGTFMVRRTGSTTAPLIVFYTVTGTATPGSDYAILPGSLTIPRGAVSALIPVTPTDDPLMEGTETVVLTLAPRTAYTVGAPSSATVNIASNEVVTVVATDPTATEAGRTTGTFMVRRTGSTTAPLIVFYTLGGTATRTGTASDYVITPAPVGSVVIPPNFLSANITVRPNNDVRSEGTETVVLALVPRPSSYTLGLPSIATVNITSN
jgi:hypothetical protein